MATFPQHLTRLFRRFAHREDGVMVAEVILVLPVFIFCIVGCYTYWDAFRSLNSAQKATYTVSDMLAREMQPVNDTYLRGLHDVMEYMMGDELPVDMRISSITFSGVRNQFEVEWSRSPYNEMPELDTTSLQPLTQYIPILADGDSVILMETNVDFVPAFAASPKFSMYVGDQEFQQFIVTRPRFIPRICLEGVACG